MKKEGRKNKDWRAAAGEYAPGAGAPPALRKKPPPASKIQE